VSGNEKTALVLVPGFLGFQSVARMPYFREVEEILRRRVGSRARVQVVSTLPTASIGFRAARLAEVLASLDAEEIHLVGHSTGGLDCRLFTSPSVRLATSRDVEQLAARVRTVVTVSTPNYGTPVATWFTGVQGHRLMRLCSLVMTNLLRHGRASVGAMVELAGLVLVLDRLSGVGAKTTNALAREIESRTTGSGGRDHSIEDLIEELGDDHTLVEQLTPASIELFNAATRDRDAIRYGCVVTRARAPSLRDRFTLGLDPVGHVSATLFAAAHRLAATMGASRLPEPTKDQKLALATAYGHLPAPGDNDGMVPTLSQLHGEVVRAVRCDHLDLMGYYGGARGSGHLDILACGEPFGRDGFEATWRAVADYMLRPA
jgi:pimeloyl-ACP methyl ester carboxylesterase